MKRKASVDVVQLGVLKATDVWESGEDANSVSSATASETSVCNVEKSLKRRKRRKTMEIPEHLFGIQTGLNRKNPLTSAGSRIILAPKGIYKVSRGYRVQLNIDNGKPNLSPVESSSDLSSTDKSADLKSIAIGVASKRCAARNKFSRNSVCFQVSMWLYEFAILISDCPKATSDMIVLGNSESMVSMQWLVTVKEYMDELEKYLKLLYSHRTISKDEFEYAIMIYQAMEHNVDGNCTINHIMECYHSSKVFKKVKSETSFMLHPKIANDDLNQESTSTKPAFTNWSASSVRSADNAAFTIQNMNAKETVLDIFSDCANRQEVISDVIVKELDCAVTMKSKEFVDIIEASSTVISDSNVSKVEAEQNESNTGNVKNSLEVLCCTAEFFEGPVEES